MCHNLNMSDLYHELNKLRNLLKAKEYARFFKTGKGEYGEGDKFLGITVPEIRKACKDYPVESLPEIRKMLQNEFHEIRFAALICLVKLYETVKREKRTAKRKQIFNFYLKNAKKVNNWDLVDTSAPYIVSDYLLDKKGERKILHELSRSKNLWERRIAVLGTAKFLKEGDFKDLEKISIRLLKDKHDLIHKAVGWMLREAGKVDEHFLRNFLDKYKNKMPRTMLRYSIERLDEPSRKKYLL
jgi:3-methyladenine DNA glycosylase AlkD